MSADKKRNISLRLGALDIVIPISDPSAEWDMRLQARIKSMALGKQGGIDMLPFETWVMGTVAGECSLPDWLLGGMAEASAVAVGAM